MKEEKELNALDGDATLKEVLHEKIEGQRKAYKRSLKSAVVRNDNAQESLAKSERRAAKTQKKLDALVNGGLKGYLTIPVDDGEEFEEATCVSGMPTRKTYKISDRWNREED